METIGAIALILLVLACPIGMLAIGGVAWAVARARGEKKDFSAGCMQHGGHAQDSAQTDETALRDRVTQLQAEVELLKAQLPGDGVSTDR
jgi:hypothetical protein